MSVESPASSAPPTGLPAWSLTTALAFVLLWVLLLILILSAFQFVGSAVIAVTEGVSLEDGFRAFAQGGVATQAVLGTASMLLSWIAIFAIVRRLLGAFTRPSILQALGLRVPQPRWALAAAILVGLVLQVVGNLLVALLRTSDEKIAIEQLMSAPIGIAAVVVMSLAIAPFAEEIFFRGFVYPPMERRFSLGSAMAANGFVFTLVHLLTYQELAFLPPVFLLGFVLAGMRSWTGSIVPGIIAHFVFNATSLLAYFLIGPDPSSGT